MNMKRENLLDFLKKSTSEYVHIAIPFENGHVEYCDDFIIEEVAEDSIAITVEEIANK